MYFLVFWGKLRGTEVEESKEMMEEEEEEDEVVERESGSRV